MKNLIIVLLDGLTRKSARENMGFLWHLTENDRASYLEIKGELPSVSKPCYESILTGSPVYEHGIAANNITRRSKMESVFSLAHQNGLKTGAAAYHWISELYNSAPFDPVADRCTYDESKNIQHGMFYFDDTYPSSHLFLDGEYLRSHFGLNLLLIHPMSLDYAGHCFGSNSKEYEGKTVEMDTILANFIPLWVSEGYGVIVTADHGMSEFGCHCGDRDIICNVFAYFINLGHPQEKKEYSQLSLAPMICNLLGIKSAESMKAQPILFK